MTKLLHTPGPWEVVGPFFDVYRKGTGDYICQSSKSQGGYREGNARVIAEAPAMAEVLRCLIVSHEAGHIDLGSCGYLAAYAQDILGRIEGAPSGVD